MKKRFWISFVISLPKKQKGIAEKAVPFLLKETRLGMVEVKTIYCPRCGRRVSQYDGRSTINVIANCKKCRKRVVYYVDTKKIEIKPIPPRSCSSGMTFC